MNEMKETKESLEKSHTRLKQVSTRKHVEYYRPTAQPIAFTYDL